MANLWVIFQTLRQIPVSQNRSRISCTKISAMVQLNSFDDEKFNNWRRGWYEILGDVQFYTSQGIRLR